MLVLTRASIEIDCPLESRVSSPLPLAHSDFPTAHFFYPKRILGTASSLTWGPIQSSGPALVPVTTGYQQQKLRNHYQNDRAMWSSEGTSAKIRGTNSTH